MSLPGSVSAVLLFRAGIYVIHGVVISTNNTYDVMDVNKFDGFSF